MHTILTLTPGSRDDIGDHSYGGESPPHDDPSDNGSDGYDDVCANCFERSEVDGVLRGFRAW